MDLRRGVAKCPSVAQSLEGAARATSERNVASYYHNTYNCHIMRSQVVRLYICMIVGVNGVSEKDKLLPSGGLYTYDSLDLVSNALTHSCVVRFRHPHTTTYSRVEHWFTCTFIFLLLCRELLVGNISVIID